MRVWIMSALGVGVATVALTTTVAPAPGARDVRLSPSYQGSAEQPVGPMKKGNCYSTLQNTTRNAVNSQNYEPDFDGYDDELVDSFSVKKTCKVTGINVIGRYYNGSGPARSETVTFYADAGGEPGPVENAQTVTGVDDAGSFLIDLETVSLPPGKHWVSVVVDMDLSAGGQWGWDLTANVKSGGESMWRNPGDGFGSGCTEFEPVSGCASGSGDAMFTLLK